jgi:hypothetical protein
MGREESGKTIPILALLLSLGSFSICGFSVYSTLQQAKFFDNTSNFLDKNAVFCLI